MSKKLQNVKAVRQMLDGTHKSQTRRQVGFSDVKPAADQKRSVGEVWTDESGVEWEQRQGFKIKKGKLDELRALLQTKMPSTCPECSQPMTKRLDEKFWKLEKRCFECQVAFEHDLRIEGKYEAYERDRIRRNAEAWLADAEQEAKALAEIFRNPLAFANADGTFEKWSDGMASEEMAKKIESDFAEFKQNFLSKLNT